MYREFCEVSTSHILTFFIRSSNCLRFNEGGYCSAILFNGYTDKFYVGNWLIWFVQEGQRVDFKNVQRRVYDALNVLSAMDIIHKDKYNIFYNHNNAFLNDQVFTKI